MGLKKFVALALVAGVVAGSLTTADAATRKKIVKYVKTSSDFFLRSADCAADTYVLSTEDATGDGTCGSFDNGPTQEINAALGSDYLGQLWVAENGVPFLLDGKTNLTGKLYVTSWTGASAGPAVLEVIFSGTTAGETTELGRQVIEYTAMPGNTELALDVDLDDKLSKKKFTTFELTTIHRGYAPLQGYYEMEDPASSFTLPTLKKKVIRR